MKEKISQFDASDYLESPEMIKEYISVMLEENGVDGLKRALSDVAKAKGMTEIAKQVGVTRASLYKSLGEDGNPGLDTINKIINAFGLKLTIS